MFSSLNPVPTFPKYRGPLDVGTAEHEIPIAELPSSSNVPDPAISTIKFRIFYPAPSSEKNDYSVSWLPEPQTEWLDAYCAFLSVPPNISKLFSCLPLPLKYTTIPAKRNASSWATGTVGQRPVLVFSHGLGGSCNAYSHLLGTLASCGVVCVAPEHRDQSAPVSVIRQADGSRRSVHYRRLSHDPNPEVLKQRNAQLRVRLWELELLYTALSRLNSGADLKNLAGSGAPSWNQKLDLRPSKVTWGGHSFGAAAVVQFVKSVFWHQAAPPTDSEKSRSMSMFEALYTPPENSTLTQQITPDSPLVLLDLWTLPLRGDTTLWLWEKPLPCFASEDPRRKTVLAIMSEEFQKWTMLLDRTKAVLSPNPTEAERLRGAGAALSHGPRLFYAPKTAHLSQSDFGLLFPWVTKMWLHAEEPERTLLLNSRAILQLLRENRLSVKSISLEDNASVDDPAVEDPAILAKEGNVQGWLPIPIE